MEYGDEMGYTGEDPANMGAEGPETMEAPSGGVFNDPTGTKIDYSSFDPVPFKKTATLVNYFITNTA